MPYVARREETGLIYGAWATEQWPGQEHIPDEHADLNEKREPPRGEAKNTGINPPQRPATQPLP